MSVSAQEAAADTAAELLRLAVPLMSRHQIPPTPHNYAVWYTYVSGENPQLQTEIDRLLGEGASFTAEACSRLYRQYVAEHDIGNIEQVRTDLTRILVDVSASLNDAGNDAQAFEGTLDGFARGVGASDDLTSIRQMLQALIIETCSMRSSTSELQQHFESKSREIEELQEQLQLERQRALTDPLTGLYNRLALIDRLNAAVAEMPNGQPPSVIMLDIDHFKLINDTHGHLIGDRVIRFVSQVLQKNIKGRDTAARYGGEEFTVLLPATGTKGAEAVAESIRMAVANAQLVRADNKKPLGQITLSAGVATYQKAEDILDLLNRADQALYRAKDKGRNRVNVA